MNQPNPTKLVSSNCSDHCGDLSIDEQPAAAASPGAVTLRIANMDCASEESEIRRALEPFGDLDNLRFDLGRRTLTLDAQGAQLDQAVAAIRKAGFQPEVMGARPAGQGAADASPAGHEHAGGEQGSQPSASWLGEGLPRLILALVFAIGAEGLSFFAPSSLQWDIAKMALAAIAIFLAGFGTYRKGFAALRAGRLNINALMTVAVTGAFLIGQWPEAAMVMALYAIAELIEARAVDRARNAIRSLLALAPEEADVRQADGSWQRMLAKAIAVDSIVRVRPGERFALDGVVSSGNGAVDQSAVTGESIPVDKAPGDQVFAGTVNAASELQIRTTAPAGDTLLARIIQAVEQAQGSRAPTQRFVDRFAAIYTPAVFVLAVLVALLTPWLMAWTWMQAIYKALVLLVIACPCALVISTPVTVVSGLAAAARRGVLIKGGIYLEEARKLKAVALDKTGTLTEGKPALVAFVVVTAARSEATVRGLALSLAARSDHPVSKAIAAGLVSADRPEELPVEDFTALPGRGISGLVGGERLTLANHRWVEEKGLCSAELEARLAEHEKQGRTVTLLASEREVLAVVAVADRIKPTSRQAVQELLALGVTPVMLTGDNATTARAIAQQAGIDEVRGPLLPDEKLTAIQQLQATRGMTAMTGDGINDAPALAKADIGFAMGGAGTHTAMEAADIVVMNDDLRRLPEIIRLSKRAHAVLVQNISLALGIKAVFLVLAVFGSASMWMAVFADMGASLLVVFNGLRLLRPERKEL
ncbi:cation-translocating P-type ATPase [Hydrogenophaga sp. IBVHS2]|uniref:heavy metal translocating P-type ATPase n=1 Tax=Hydrogenophaga sp. IBVHS2 TaxID=1985170 RepID=UPI000A2D1596|nr:cation-translocating P-type ATPase [Hydrogenophaga sp. IBVHS2]OSZ64853.1 copper-translocating P-type ATPase [Hydrogenophaga sp. IBVHS2]